SGEGTRQNGTVTSGEGAPVRVKDLLRKAMPDEDTRPLQLFIKNIALCKHVSGRIGCDACPVPEGEWMGLAHAKLLIEAPVNGGRNYNGPKVAKFLVG